VNPLSTFLFYILIVPGLVALATIDADIIWWGRVLAGIAALIVVAHAVLVIIGKRRIRRGSSE